ncbi:hypothetical protein UlMin_028678 [Ulmus minor]
MEIFTLKVSSSPNSCVAPCDVSPTSFPRQVLHWKKYGHSSYVDNLNKQIAGTELDGVSLEDVIFVTYNKRDLLPPFNNAVQVWNHDFFWESMKLGGGGKSSRELLELIERDFGSFDKIVAEFKSPAATQFGSYRACLVYKKLAIAKSPNVVNSLAWDIFVSSYSTETFLVHSIIYGYYQNSYFI